MYNNTCILNYLILTYFIIFFGILLLLDKKILDNSSDVVYKNVLQSSLVPKTSLNFYILFLMLYLLYCILFSPELHAMQPDVEDIKSTIEFYQNEVVSISSVMSEQGLNVDNSMLTPEQQAIKAEYTEALKDSREALSSNIGKLKEAKVVDISEVLGKRGAQSDYSSTPVKK